MLVGSSVGAIAVLAHATILIIAGEDAVRLPLSFMLSAEGHEVLPRGTVDAQAAFDCIVIDDKAFRTARQVSEAFGAFGKPIVLLTDRSTDESTSQGVITVQKPLLGSAVTDAVATALASEGAAGTPPLRTIP